MSRQGHIYIAECSIISDVSTLNFLYPSPSKIPRYIFIIFNNQPYQATWGRLITFPSVPAIPAHSRIVSLLLFYQANRMFFYLKLGG